jgi:hypothetical protein
VSDVGQARRFALALPGATEEPHFDMASSRVRGKIFATVPPGGDRLHVFVDEAEVHACVAENPEAFEPLQWGKRIRGVRVWLAAAAPGQVQKLIAEAWRRKAPKSLTADERQPGDHGG